MNKKLFFIPIGIGLAILLIIAAVKPATVHGTKAEMEVPATAASKADAPKALTVILDNSGSMQGYVNFKSTADGFAEAKQTMVTNVADFMGNVDSRFSITSTARCGIKSYTSDQLIQAMRNYSAFSGAITELDGLTQKAIEMASDTAVSVIVSDMILSYGKAAVIRNGKDYNRHELPALSSLVGNQFKQLKKKDIGVLILKYTGDFNGNYYFNCTENVEPCEFKNTLLKNRPYYFFVIGKERYIKALCVDNCFPKPEEVFSTIEFDDEDMMKQPFTVTTTQSSLAWNVGEVNGGNDEPICLWTKDNFGDAMAKFEFKFDEIVIPLYARGNVVADFDRDVVSNVTFDSASLNYLNVTLNQFNKLPKSDNDVEIELEVERGANTASLSSLDVDYGITPAELEGKTWGFASIIEKIYEAYGIKADDTDTIAKLEFSISKK